MLRIAATAGLAARCPLEPGLPPLLRCVNLRRSAPHCCPDRRHLGKSVIVSRDKNRCPFGSTNLRINEEWQGLRGAENLFPKPHLLEACSRLPFKTVLGGVRPPQTAWRDLLSAMNYEAAHRVKAFDLLDSRRDEYQLSRFNERRRPYRPGTNTFHHSTVCRCWKGSLLCKISGRAEAGQANRRPEVRRAKS